MDAYRRYAVIRERKKGGVYWVPIRLKGEWYRCHKDILVECLCKECCANPPPVRQQGDLVQIGWR